MIATKREQKQTPWGPAQGQEVLAEGIISYSTASHGGIWLSPERARQIPEGVKNFLGGRTWWEEDCDWVVPYLLFEADIRAAGTAYAMDRNYEAARMIAARYHPELLAHLRFGRLMDDGLSYVSK